MKSIEMKRYCPASFLITLIGISTISFVLSFPQRSAPSWVNRRQLGKPLYGTNEVHATPDKCEPHSNNSGHFLKQVSFASLILYSVALQSVTPVWADEYGRETEAPTFFTGENVMVRSYL